MVSSPISAVAAQLCSLRVVNSATDNTLYTLESTFVDPATGSYGYNGRLYGFKDTFIGTATQSSPADKAVQTTTTEATVAWAAFTGATNYEVWYGKSATLDTGTVYSETSKTTSATLTTAIVEGTTYYWKVRAISSVTAGTATLPSKWSTIRSFITAVSAPVVQAEQLPKNGATDVAIDTTFTWPVSRWLRCYLRVRHR